MDAHSDTYITVAREAQIQLKVRRSLFMARVRETPGEAAAREFVRLVCREHPNADHNCWAWRLGQSPPYADAWSDDGEPDGTAGRPIHGAISRQDLSNVTLVVTRYFGGKKLGVRGLIETYAEAAQAALEEAGIARRRLHGLLAVECGYQVLGQVQGLLAAAQGSIAGADYGERVSLRLSVPLDELPALRDQLAEMGLAVKTRGEGS